MIFRISRAAGFDDRPPCKNAVASPQDDGSWYVEINTLEDLLALHKEVVSDPESRWCSGLILNEDGKSLTVYDYYTE